jgi:DNA-directed RNA polymerase I, II, and III subunit RPABC2
MDYIKKYHTQEITEDYEEISILATVKRNEDGVIIDSKHITTPIMTKYEKTRILGLRISQLNNGAPSLYVPENMIIDNNIIAEIELRDKLLPFIVSRPLPNGSKEHWRIQDLEIL